MGRCSLQGQLRTSPTSAFPSFLTGDRFRHCLPANLACRLRAPWGLLLSSHLHSCLGFAPRVLLAQVYCTDRPCQYLNCWWADAAAGSTLSSQVLQGLPQRAVPWAEVPCESTTTNELLPSSAHAALLDVLHLSPQARVICASCSESSYDLCGLFKFFF